MIRGLARRAAPLVVLLLVPASLHAQDQRAVLEIVVNSVPGGEAFVTLRGNDVLVPVSALTSAGLQEFGGRRERLNTTEVVSLASLAPDVTFRIDEANLRLLLTVPPELFRGSVRDLGSGAPAGLEFRTDPSAYVNYSLRYSRNNSVDLFTESVMSVNGMSFYNALTANQRATTRGVTSLTYDDRPRMRRWTFGDAFAYGGPLGGDAWLAGVTFAKEYGIDPYFVRFPTLSLSTPIATPSVMEVYVNGQVVQQEPVAPGRLDIRNVPLTLGRNDARIIVRDAFGGTRELTSTYYLSASALAPGLHDYQYSVGFRREGVGTSNWDYRTPAVVARHRVGVTSSLTLGARAESDFGDVLSVGPTINLRLPFGDFEGAGSASRTDKGWGAAALGGFSFTTRTFSTGGSITLASNRYATLSSIDTDDTSVRQVNLFASSHLGGPITMTVQHAFDERLNDVSRTRTGVLSTIRLGRRMELAVSATRVLDEKGRDRELYAGLTYLFKRASMSLSHRNDRRNGSRFALDAQQPAPVGVGYGAQFRVESGDGGDQLTGAARYQSAHGVYEVRQERFGEHTESSVSAMGAIVAIGGSVHATRPVTESFALVRVPGVEGVRAYASNQEIGRTDKKGNLLIPNLQAYYGNILGIDDADVPLLYSVANVRKLLAPPYRGGAVAEFPVERVQRIMGRIVLLGDESRRQVAYGQLDVKIGSEAVSSPLGADGGFYFENLTPGRYPAVVEYRNGQCIAELVVPSSDELTVKLGEIECRRTDGQ